MKNKKIYFIGGAIIALAILIILSVTVLPAAVHKAKMGEMLDLAASTARLSVGDPLFETGDVLGNKGKEILLEGESLGDVTALLTQLTKGGYRTAGTQKMTGGTLAMNLKARTDTGETLILYFEETRFFYLNNTTAIFFEAKSESAYRALYQKMISCLNA